MHKALSRLFLHPAWTITDAGRKLGVTGEHLGLIPMFLNVHDTRPAAEQINEAYSHGGGWRPFSDKWTLDPQTHVLTYDAGTPDAETYEPLATAQLNGERLFFYDCAWTAIVQADGAFEVARLD